MDNAFIVHNEDAQVASANINDALAASSFVGLSPNKGRAGS